MKKPPVRIGDSVTLVVHDLAFGGSGVARVDGFTVFVRGGLPGQTVRARITKRKSGFAEARIDEVLVRAPEEIEPVCAHFGPCGGCLWQNLDYGRQLAAKGEQVADCLVRLGGLSDPPMDAPLGAPEPFRYRNKMEFSFSDRIFLDHPPPRREPGEERPREFGLGLHARGRFDRVLNNRECHLAPAWMAEVLGTVRRATEESGLAPYDIRGHGGFWRFLVLREGRRTGERMLQLITWPRDSGSAAVVDEVVDRVMAEHPGVTSALHGTSGRLASIAYAESTRVVRGADRIHERLLEDDFAIGPDTFFQTNTLQAERLFSRALEFIREPVVLAWDLYCGVGALTLPVARRVGRVVGAELIGASVEAARANAERNGHANTRFVAVDMKEAISREGLRDRDGHLVSGPPDLVLVDPPRDGLHADVTQGLIALGVPRLIYVSCNPATLARDAGRFVESGYRLEAVTPVDMFPQTAHVEVVAALRRG